MTCRRAFELDVPAFVVDPRDPAWDDFRAHYPRCTDCAAEVAAWTAVQASLAERHPEPEELLRWNDAPDALAAHARAAIERHVERCTSCRDELRALGGFAAVHAPGANAAAAALSGADHAATHATGATEHAHHPSASRTGGRHAERHAFAREGSARGAAHAGAPAGGARSAGRRGPVARVLLHPAFAYAVLVLVLLLPGVRAALDRDAGRAAFDAPATSLPEQAPAAAPQSITGSSRRVQAERDDAAEENAAGRPDDAHVDRTAPRLMRQAPFHPEPPAPPAAAPAPAPVAAPPPPAGAVAPAAKAAATLEEGRLARGGQAADAPAPAAAGAALHDALSSADTSRRERAPGSGTAPAAPIRLLPATGGAARTLVVVLPPSAATAANVEIRVVDAGGGRELRQRIPRAPGAEPEVQMTLPAGFGAAILQVEVYADGAGPLLQGSVAP